MTSRKRDVWQCPEYFNEFGKEEKIRCKEKLTLTDGTKITDPYGLSNNWKKDVSLLPDISWADMYNYLINTLNAYTDENLKAYNSLEVFNFFVYNHVQDVFCHSVSEESKFCCVKTGKIEIVWFEKCLRMSSILG